MAKPSKLELYREAMILEYAHAKRDLGLFVQAAWDVLEPNVELKWNWHHDLICEHLQAAALGQINRLIINVAPRSTKSILTTICFPDWLWIADPSTRFLFGSYAGTLATKHSVLRRNLIESQWYQQGYGHRFKLSSDVNTKSEFTNNNTGQMKATGIQGAVTGEGCDYLVIDDPHNPSGVQSDLEREATIDNFDLAWSTRLNNKKTGRIIVIMQRLRENDLTGHLLAKDMGYVHLKIPTIAEERQTIIFPITKRVIERETGDLMHPERDGPEEIEKAKLDLGPYGFSGQHQQSPTPKSGGLFKPEMFEYVDIPTDFDYKFIMADTAYNDKKENDFTVFTAFGVIKEKLYIIDVFRKQIKSVDVEVPARAFILRFSQHGFRGAYIEPKGHGIYLNVALARKGPNGESPVMIPGEKDIKEFFADRKYNKTERANNSAPQLANRKVYINNQIHNKELLVDEALKFPKAAHDDFVDTLIDGVKFVYARKPSILDVL